MRFCASPYLLASFMRAVCLRHMSLQGMLMFGMWFNMTVIQMAGQILISLNQATIKLTISAVWVLWRTYLQINTSNQTFQVTLLRGFLN